MIVAALVALVGALLLAIALRGRRIDDHPICRRCRFDLIGVHGRSDRCPECGRSLAGRRALRIGHRRVRRRLAASAILVLLASLVAGGVLGWTSVTGVDWNTHKPEWWLAADARGGGADTPAVLLELDRRLQDGTLSMGRTLEMIELGMINLQDEMRTWEPEWAVFLETARRADLLSPEQLHEYVQSLATVSLRMRPRMAQAMPWGMQLRIINGRAYSRDLQLRITSTGLWVDDAQIDNRSLHRATINIGKGAGATSFTYGSPWLMALAPGEYRVRLAMRYAVVDRWVGAVGEWDQDFESTLHVVAPGQPLVELIHDDSLRASVRESIEIRSAGLSNDGRVGEGLLLVKSAPVDMLLDIYWRFDDASDPEGYRELRMGGLAAKAGEQSGSRYSRSLHADVPPERIDIILRPAIGAAANRVEFDRIWGEEIVFESFSLAAPDQESP